MLIASLSFIVVVKSCLASKTIIQRIINTFRTVINVALFDAFSFVIGNEPRLFASNTEVARIRS